ncbi:MAG: hypothetical protein AAFY60_09235 [Myxococcota bacterium]
MNFDRRQFLEGAAALGLTSACAGLPMNGRKTDRELLLVNGAFWTQNPQQPEARAVAIRGEKIVGVGEAGSVSPE